MSRASDCQAFTSVDLVGQAQGAPLAAPKLAIVITCYNYEAFVGRAIRSVLVQARDDCELVVVDDGSIDGSWAAICESGAAGFRTGNHGQRLAGLFGLDKTRAPFVLFLDADDELKPGALATIIGSLDPKVAKLQFSLTRIGSEGHQGPVPHILVDDFRDADGGLADQVLRTGVYKTPPTSGNVFRRDVCELMRDATYDAAIDGFILFAAPFKGDVVSISQELGCYRIHDRNISGIGDTPNAANLDRDLKRFIARLDHLRSTLADEGDVRGLTSPGEAFYFLERSLYLDVLSGRRPLVSDLGTIVRALSKERLSVRQKFALIVFLASLTILPNAMARRAVDYRFRTGPRSAAGLTRLLLSRTRAMAPAGRRGS